MRRFEEGFRRRALFAAAVGLLTAVLPRLCRAVLRLQAGKTRFAGQEAGFLAWEGRRGKALFCSTGYDPDWDLKAGLPAGQRAVLAGIAGLWRDARRRRSAKDCKK